MTTLTSNWTIVKAANPTQFYREFITKNLRPDGRTFLQRRPVKITSGSISTADGSCLTNIGTTSVLAAIKLEISSPHNATPTSGFLEVSVQLTPLCSPRFNVGKPSDEAFSLQQHIQRILVESKVIDLEQLNILEGKACWNVKLDIICLNHNGSCTDAAILAAVGALRDLKLPAVVTKVEDTNQSSRGVVVEIDPSGIASKLNMGSNIPLPLTYGKFENVWIVDPNAEEASLMQTMLTVVVGNNGKKIYSVYKVGGESVPSDFLDKAIDSATVISKQALDAMLVVDVRER